MKILFDHQMFSTQKFGGITRYFCELMKNIPSEHQFKLASIFSDNHYIEENKDIFHTINFLPDKNFKWKGHIKDILYYINQYYSKLSIITNDFDLFHPTYYDDYFLNRLKKPFIITVHDLTHMKFKDINFIEDGHDYQMRKVINSANRIIAISENTKNDLIEILNINPNKIDVIHHGYSRRNNIVHSEKVKSEYEKYILYVGERIGHKNFKRFVEAIGELLKIEKHLRLFCVGRPFNDEENLLLSGLGIIDQTIALHVDEDTLNYLYSNALLFVFPSIYEGFGMPILEAFANNCPVCLSNTSCFPEIAGNAGAFFNPYEQESILFAVKSVIYNSSYAAELVSAGQERLKDFSWKKTVDKTLSSYYKTI